MNQITDSQNTFYTRCQSILRIQYNELEALNKLFLEKENDLDKSLENHMTNLHRMTSITLNNVNDDLTDDEEKALKDKIEQMKEILELNDKQKTLFKHLLHNNVDLTLKLLQFKINYTT